MATQAAETEPLPVTDDEIVGRVALLIRALRHIGMGKNNNSAVSLRTVALMIEHQNEVQLSSDPDKNVAALRKYINQARADNQFELKGGN